MSARPTCDPRSIAEVSLDWAIHGGQFSRIARLNQSTRTQEFEADAKAFFF